MANTLITAQGGAVDKIYRHDGFSSTVDNSISAPSSGPGDVAVRSNDVIVSDWDAEEKIYQLTGFTSTVRNSVAAADDSVFGVNWDGTNLLEVDVLDDRFMRLSGFGTSVTSSYVGQRYNNYALGWDGTNALSGTSGGTSKKFHKYSGFTSSVSSSVSYPSTYNVRADAWQHDSNDAIFWISTGSTNVMQRMNGFSSTVEASFASESQYAFWGDPTVSPSGGATSTLSLLGVG